MERERARREANGHARAPGPERRGHEDERSARRSRERSDAPSERPRPEGRDRGEGSTSSRGHNPLSPTRSPHHPRGAEREGPLSSRLGLPNPPPPRGEGPRGDAGRDRGKGLPPPYRGRDRHSPRSARERLEEPPRKRPLPDPPAPAPPGKRRSVEEPPGGLARPLAPAPGPPREATGFGGFSGMHSELRAAALQAMKKQREQKKDSQPEEEPEPGELAAPSRASRHSPIVWDSGAGAAAREGKEARTAATDRRSPLSGRGGSASPAGDVYSPEVPQRPSSRNSGRRDAPIAEPVGVVAVPANGHASSAAARAALEVAAFKGRRAGGPGGSGEDPEGGSDDAPAALRASPSVSDEEDDTVARMRARLEAQAVITPAENPDSYDDGTGEGKGGGGEAAAGDAAVAAGSKWQQEEGVEGEGEPAAPGVVKSRWALDEEEEAEAGRSQRRTAFPAPTIDVKVEPPEPSPRGSDRAGNTPLLDPTGEGQGEPQAIPPVPARGFPARQINMLRSCRNVDCFERLNHISEGTYGVVYRAKEVQPPSNKIYALKKVKMDREKDGFPLTSIREINILLSFHHPNIVDVTEVVVGSKLDAIFMVMEFMDHDLKQLLEEMPRKFTIAEVKCLMKQLLEGMHYLHDNWVLHRDLKTSNILYSNKGELKICDFGLARQYGSPLKPFTHQVVTLHYRAPELLLGAKTYSTAIDVWSIGCIMAELITKQVLFKGVNEADQLNRILALLGKPTEANWPGVSKLPHFARLAKPATPREEQSKLREAFPVATGGLSFRERLSSAGFRLLEDMLNLDPQKRIKTEQALQSEWFTEQPRPLDTELMPTYPTSKEGKKQGRPRQTAATRASPEGRAAHANSIFGARR